MLLNPTSAFSRNQFVSAVVMSSGPWLDKRRRTFWTLNNLTGKDIREDLLRTVLGLPAVLLHEGLLIPEVDSGLKGGGGPLRPNDVERFLVAGV